MTFHLIGVNHNTAPVEVRERLALPESRLPEACKSLCQQDGIEEGMILSTCNRVELLVRSSNGSSNLRNFVRDYFHPDPAEYDRLFYEYGEEYAVRRIFRFSPSLDSMVAAEPQILGQVKEAYAVARA